MISSVILNELDSRVSALTKGSNAFAEAGEGSRYVVVKTAKEEPFTNIDEIKMANIQISAVGWPYDDGYALSEEVTGIVGGMLGDYSHDGKTYQVRTSNISGYPVPGDEDSGKSFKMNFKIVYIIKQ